MAHKPLEFQPITDLRARFIKKHKHNGCRLTNSDMKEQEKKVYNLVLDAQRYECNTCSCDCSSNTRTKLYQETIELEKMYKQFYEDNGKYYGE